jgi:hypothetical protein
MAHVHTSHFSVGMELEPINAVKKPNKNPADSLLSQNPQLDSKKSEVAPFD